MTKEKIVVIIGPTGVGKTALSIDLAKRYQGQVINADSMQVYKDLNIGTAKVTEEEAEGVIHHLLDIREVNQEYDASEFATEAGQKIHEISQDGKLPLIVGGTGLYVEGLLYGFSYGGEGAEAHPEFRKEMQELVNTHGREYLWEKLQAVDPKAAETIHPNNVRRVIRALEVCQFENRLFSDQEGTEEKREALYDHFIIALNTDRDLLYNRINRRVDLMLKQGLLEEAKWLCDQKLPPKTQATRGIGYKEFFPYFDNQISLEEAVEQLKQNSRRYAKRQLTWFRNRLPESHWYNLVEDPNQLNQIHQDLEEFLRK